MPINNNDGFNEDMLNQLPQLKAGINDLRDAINSLNKEITNSTDKFTKLNVQNKETVSWGTKIKSTVKELIDTYDSFSKAIDMVSKALQAGKRPVT